MAALRRTAPPSDDELTALKMMHFNRIEHETGGWAFFAWHRLRWPGPYFVDHSDEIPYSCQRCGPGKELACRAIWENPDDR